MIIGKSDKPGKADLELLEILIDKGVEKKRAVLQPPFLMDCDVKRCPVFF